MIYYFTYELNKRYLKKVCYSFKEASIFFDILISARATHIRVLTIKKRGHDYDKI